MPPRTTVFDHTMRHVATAVTRGGTEKDATGGPKPVQVSVATNVPCDLQEMTTARSVQFRTGTDATRYDLFVPSHWGSSPELVNIGIGWRFTIDGVVYQTVGKALDDGSGVLRIPVEERDQ